MALELIPVSLEYANSFVEKYHRHNRPVPGHKFSLAAQKSDGTIVGVAIIGRPVARHMDDGWTLEVNRTCTDGTKNANSFLYAAAWRATRALGYLRLVTYTMKDESQSTMKAVGWRCIGERRAREWSCLSRPRITKHSVGERYLWEAV